MVDADFQNTDLYVEIGRQLQESRPAIVQQIDLNDESISPALRGKELTPERILADLMAQMRYEDARHTIDTLLEEVEQTNLLSSESASKISANMINTMSLEERATLLVTLVQSEASPQHLEALVRIVASVNSGAEFRATEQARFFDIFDGLPETLGTLLGELPQQGAAEVLADSYVRSLLVDLARSVPNQALQERYQNPDLSTKELIGVLEHVNSSERLDCLNRLLRASGADSSTDNFLRDKLDNALYYASRLEKTLLLTTLLESGADQKLAASILASSASLEELTGIVESVGAHRLLALEDQQLTEYVAHVVLGNQVRSVSLPIRNSESIDPHQALADLEALTDALQEIIEICEGSPQLKNTQVALDYVRTALDDLNRIGQELSLVAEDPEKLSELADTYTTIAAIEFRYGVNLSVSEVDRSGSLEGAEECTLQDFGVNLQESAVDLPEEEVTPKEQLRWRMTDLKDIQRVLEAIPESDLHFTPMLRDIELVETLGWGVLGARYHSDGRIKISTLTLDNDSLSSKYEGQSSLVIVLGHEIGHGIQIGDGKPGFDWSHDTPSFGEGEESIDFDEYLELSGWEVIDRGRYEQSENWGTIILDGEEVALEQPIDHQEKRIVLKYDFQRDLLIQYDADADFSSRWYAKTSPWEDFAEAFSEYLFLPERLLEDAPQKFKHLDQEFRRYADDQDLQRQLKEELEERNSTPENSLGVVPTAERFITDPWVF